MVEREPPVAEIHPCKRCGRMKWIGSPCECMTPAEIDAALTFFAGTGATATAEEKDAASELDLNQRFGQTVRSMREHRGWSLTELADRYGGARSYLYQIERGTSSPTLTTMYALAMAFGCTIPELLEVGTVTEGPWQRGYVAGQADMRQRVLAAITTGKGETA